MLTISYSVGVEGKNQKSDVLKIQQAFNKIKALPGDKRLVEDGLYGESTAKSIVLFQKNYVKMKKPDGRIDPGGKSIGKLAVLMTELTSDSRPLFPLNEKPEESYKTGMRAFGASRAGGKRKHAGVDLYAQKGTPIRAMKDGEIIQDYNFYLGTRALEVDHGDMILRYGEISHVAEGIAAGVKVKRGQVIAYVGELVFKSGNKMSMLHLEAYKGTDEGALTVRDLKPYQRRSDLFDPTELLDNSVME